MTYKEFLAISQSRIDDTLLYVNNYVEVFDLSMELDSDYDFGDKHWVALYEGGSVLEGTIRIGINLPKIYKWGKDKSVIDIKKQISLSVFHELGHALIEYFNNEIEVCQETSDEPYSAKVLDLILSYNDVFDGDEEYIVEEYASFMDGYTNESRLNDFITEFNEIN